MCAVKSIHVVLVHPEIPQNTGNIARTCAAVGAKLHLIKPLGFSIENRYLKRAGLDYWHLVDVYVYEDFEEFKSKHPHGNCAFITKRAPVSYDKIKFSGDVFLIFGSETGGLPEESLEKKMERCYRIPMISEARSLNLSNAVAVVVYEALRKNGFNRLELRGDRGCKTGQ